MAGQGYEEKRDFFRMRINGSVRIQRQGDAEDFDAEGIDLSASGLSLIADSSVNEGEVLRISIKSHNPELADFVAEATVINVRPVAQQSGKHHIAVRFTAIY